MKLSRDVQIVLGGAVLFFILSFLDWQSVSYGPYSYGVNLWHGFGVLVALVAIVLLAWEILRALGREVKIGSFPPGLISVTLAGLLLVLTVIIFLDWSDYRSWPEWVGLVLAIVIGVFAFRRAKAEGVDMPSMPKGSMGGGPGRSGGMNSGGGSSSIGGSTGEGSSGGTDPSV